MYLQSIKSIELNAAKSVNRSSLKKSRHVGFGVFIVHSSILVTESYQITVLLKEYNLSTVDITKP